MHKIKIFLNAKIGIEKQLLGGTHMANSINQVSYKKWIQSAFIIGIMFIIGLLPPFGQITPLGMKILGIFLGCVAS